MANQYLTMILASMLAAAALLQPAGKACERLKPTPSETMLLLQAADHDKSVDLRIGQSIAIVLPENASTGYRWQIDRYDQSLIEAVGSEPHYTGRALGSGGEIKFIFKGLRLGSGEITLKQWRRWQGDSSIIRRYRLHLNVCP